MLRHLLSLGDFTPKDIVHIFALTKKLKKSPKKQSAALQGKTIGLLFQKPSNRTRVSFEVGIWQLGGNCLYLGPEEINLGVRESVSDVAKTLSRYLDGLVARTHSHQDIINLAEFSTIPVINGLSDCDHPCQALADLFSIQEKLGKLKGLTLAYIGDGNNVCHSLLLGCGLMGIHMQVATPQGYEPQQRMINAAQSFARRSRAQIALSHEPQEAIKNAQVVYSDVWVSMGQENEADARIKAFQGFQINEGLTERAHPRHIFMHCLPAHRGEEVTSAVIDGPRSIVFDQAENRLHVQKAILIYLLSQVKKGRK